MFGWLKKKREKTQPEARWTVGIHGDSIHMTDEAGATTELLKSDLSGVVIETNDSRPWGADVWWLLFGADQRVVLAYPQGATGEDVLLDYLQALPDFDHAAMIKAMTSTENAIFPVWRHAG